jgi:hypothetical protein
MNRPTAFALFVVATVLCACGPNERTGDPRPAPAAPRATSADFTVFADKPAGPPLVGFGGECNPYLYCTPNWGADVTEDNVADLERKVRALRPQHVRVFFLLDWWDGVGDAVIAKGDPRAKDSFLRVCRLAQDAGATINVTLWYGKTLYTDPEGSARRFAAALADMRRSHGLSAVRYVTMQNEVNLHGSIKMEPYNRLYRALDVALRDLGLRDEIQIIGGDLVQNDQAAWFANLAEHQHDVLDGYAVHMYWDYWDTQKLIRRISEVPPIVAALPETARKPLYVTEFGVRGRRPEPKREPGTTDDGTPVADTTLQASQVAWFVMEALNRGYVATVQWELYDAWYDRFMPYGVIGGAKLGFPLKPGYHVLRLFTHTAGPGWRAAAVEADGGTLNGKLASALRGPAGEWTVYALNVADAEQPFTIRGLPPGATFFFTLWNADGTGRLTAASSRVTDDTGVVHLTLPPRTLAALTTTRPSFADGVAGGP